MTSEEIHNEIIALLGNNPRGLDQRQITASLGQAPTRVGAELRALGRKQQLSKTGELWCLADRPPGRT